jgi:hypothetical protein
MMFVEFNKRKYLNGGYITTKIMFNLNDICRVVECSDDWHFTNIITTDGEVHTIADEYSNVSKKIFAAEEQDGN